MFKAGRWRAEKKKIKVVVFKLQFHVSQVPKSQCDALMLSVVPQDTGRPTLSSAKATVRDGSCYWENPVYETIKFVHDPKSGKICKRLYRLCISTGLSKTGAVEVLIDFSDYAEGTTFTSASLPLKILNYDAVLHVLIEKMKENGDQIHQGGIQKTEDTKVLSKDNSLRAQLSFEDTDDSTTTNSTEDGCFYKTNLRNVEPNNTSGSDLTVSSSESSSGFNTPRELGNKYTTAESDQNPTKFLLSSVNSPSLLKEQQKSLWEWSEVGSLDNPPLKKFSDAESENLKKDFLSLSRQADMSDLEVQTLRKQIMKESKQVQELEREMSKMKRERDAYKEEFENLKALHSPVVVRKKSRFDEGGDPRVILEELRQELDYEKDLNENLQLQLQKTQESNSELILAVQDLDKMLEKKDKEITNLCDKSFMDVVDEEQKALEHLVKKHEKSKEAHFLDQQIIDLQSQVELCSRDKEELEMQMEQLALDYEILKQENHKISYRLEQSQIQEDLRIQYECSGSFATISELESQINNLEDHLKKQSKDLSDSASTIGELRAYVKNLEEELKRKDIGFEADLSSMSSAKIEQEKRAIRAEEALRLTKQRNANAAEKIQEEFKHLASELASSFDENEKMTTKALNEACKLRLEKTLLEESLKNAEAKILEFLQQIELMTAQMEHMGTEIEDKSIQIARCSKHGEELSKEIKICRFEVQTLQKENDEFNTLRDALAKMKASMEESEILHRSELKSAAEEKERSVASLQSHLETLGVRYKDLEHSVLEDELEKKKLRKQVSGLRGEFRRDSKASPRSTKSGLSPQKEIAALRGKIKSLEDVLETSTKDFLEKNKAHHGEVEELENIVKELRLSDNLLKVTTMHNSTIQSTSGDLISVEETNPAIDEMGFLKERIKLMEDELKEMQERYSEISLKFAEVEGERQMLVMTVRNLKNTAKN